METNQQENKRKRGAPRGNQNALKHGYYSKTFRASEKRDLEKIDQTLISELNVLRVIGRRIMEQLRSQSIDSETLTAYINTMLKITLSIAKIYNIQSIIDSRSHNVGNELSEIINQITNELTQGNTPTEEQP